MKVVGFFALTLALLAPLTGGASPGPRAWTSAGPEGGEVLSLAFDRAEPQTVYAATMGGVFRSTTGGESWARASRGLPPGPVAALALQPGAPQVVYAAHGKGIWKSVDGAESWTRLDRRVTPAANPLEAGTLAAAPSAPQTVYALVPFRGWFGPSTVWRSRDGGRTWAVRSSKAPAGRALAVDPVSSQTLYLGSGRGVFRSEDGGRTWRRRLTRAVASVLADPAAGGTVYAGGHGGRVYASATGSAVWRQVGSLHDGGRVTALALDPEAHVLWAGTSRPYGSTLASSLYRSADGGRSWTRAGSSLGSSIRSVAAGSSTLAASDLGVWKSAGAAVAPANSGLVATTVGTVAADPVRPLVAYAEASWTVFATRDGGASWHAASRLPVKGAASVELAIDPRHPSTVYAAALVYPGPSSGFVAKSSDGARTWRVVKAGVKAVTVAVAPSRPRVVYAGTLGRGAFRSEDGGATWARCGSGPARLGTLALDPRRPDTVYAGTWEWKRTTKGAVYRSTDGCATWRAVAGLPTSGVNDLAVDQRRPRTVWAAMVSGLYRSDDGGQSWRRVAGGMQRVVPDPRRAGVVYASRSSGVFVTRNGGRTWQPASAGLPGWFPTSLAISARGTSILVGTYGNGVAVARLPLAARR